MATYTHLAAATVLGSEVFSALERLYTCLDSICEDPRMKSSWLCDASRKRFEGMNVGGMFR